MVQTYLNAYLQPGARVGDFEVVQTLPNGQGGMATVFIGRPRHKYDGFPEQVAVKVSLSDEQNWQNFLKHEVHFLAKFDHPHVVQIYPLPKSGKRDMAITDLGSDQTQRVRVYYYAMEYLSGGTLRAMLTSRGRLTLFETVTIGSQLAAALEHIHAHKVINLDIKPDNILFRPAPRRWLNYGIPEAVLCDFGASRAIDEPTLGIKVGSPPYISPEHIHETATKSDVGYHSDLFLLGILLYEMSTGKLPFEHLGQTIDPGYSPIPPAQQAPGIPLQLDNLIMKALAKDPAHRFHNAREMRLALETVPKGIFWRGLPQMLIPIFFTLLFIGLIYLTATFLPLVSPTPTTPTPTITTTMTITQSTSTVPPTITPTLIISPTATMTIQSTVTPAPTRTPTLTPVPTTPPPPTLPTPIP